MKEALIPKYEFSVDDARSIAFKLVPLEVKNVYDPTLPHRHNYYEIFVFLEGGGKHTIDFDEFEIRKNSVHFVSPGQVHHIERDLNTHGVVILFSREFISLEKQNQALLFDLPFLHNARFPVLNLKEDQAPELLGMIDQIKQESDLEEAHSAEMLRSLLKIFLMKADRIHKTLFPDVEEQYKSSVYRDFRLLLEENFVVKHKVQDYASMMSMSEKQLNQICKTAVGTNVSDIITNRLILEAKRLLMHSSESTKEIAYVLHFNDPAHFSKFFKAKSGWAPSDFRNLYR